MTKRYTLLSSLGLTAFALGACDLPTKSLTDGGMEDDAAMEESSGSATSGGTGTSEGSTSGADSMEATSSSESGSSSSSSESSSTSKGSESTSMDGDDGISCTAIGCSDGVLVHLLQERMPDGVYEIYVYSSPWVDVATQCGFVLSGGEVLETSCEHAVVVSDGVQVFMNAAFETMRFEVVRDGALVGEIETSPVYEEVMPNGPECPPVCLQGDVSIPLVSFGLASCLVNGMTYEHGATVPDPFSCNTCSCNDGQVDICTEIGCPIECPEGTLPGTECAECGPTDACLVVHTGCLPVCNEAADCAGGPCIEGVCRSLCG